MQAILPLPSTPAPGSGADLGMTTMFTPLSLSSNNANAYLSPSIISSLLARSWVRNNPTHSSNRIRRRCASASADNMPSSGASQGNQSNLGWSANLDFEYSAVLEGLPALTAEGFDEDEAAADQMGATAQPQMQLVSSPPLRRTVQNHHGDEQQKEDLDLLPPQQQQQQQQQPSNTKNKKNKKIRHRHSIGRSAPNMELYSLQIAFFVEIKSLFEMNHPSEDFHQACSGKGNKGRAILQDLYDDVKETWRGRNIFPVFHDFNQWFIKAKSKFSPTSSDRKRFIKTQKWLYNKLIESEVLPESYYYYK